RSFDVGSLSQWLRPPPPRPCPIPRGCFVFQPPPAARSSFVTLANFTLSLKKAALPAELPADQVTLPSRASPPTGRNSLSPHNTTAIPKSMSCQRKAVRPKG